MNVRIVVAHAGRQHSHQLAAALHARGALHEYWTGLPMRRSALHPRATYAEVELPEECVRVLPIGATGHFLERHLIPGRSESVLGQLGDYAVDWIYSRRLRALGTKVSAIVGYENSSLATFRAARDLGVRTILDAAALHHAAADRWRGQPPASGWARDVRKRKDAEIACADHVLVLSQFARDSYIAAGVPEHRISIVPLGYDPGVFCAAGEPRTGKPLRFVFVGNSAHTKGLDLLLDAATRLQASGAPFQLVVVGDVNAEMPPGVERRGKLSQRAIAAEFAGSDCLVLPSRCDAFGLVVPEALGSGLPAIVSEHVGAKDVVVESGAGWIVAAGDAAALAERMRWCIEYPQEVIAAKCKARDAAPAWTWERYGTRVAETVVDLPATDAGG